MSLWMLWRKYPDILFRQKGASVTEIRSLRQNGGPLAGQLATCPARPRPLPLPAPLSKLPPPGLRSVSQMSQIHSLLEAFTLTIPGQLRLPSFSSSAPKG